MRLSKFRGLHRHTFLLHLKESRWRFNHRHLNTREMYHEVLKILKEVFWLIMFVASRIFNEYSFEQRFHGIMI